ncbi:S-adenosylmethionine-binding protein [Salmonella enterica]|nr:S-adenosylmethionine-binding protein [Salmonella enterica]EAO0118492.1 S-adenosylmethionine-binding protein [Salmonella enterica]EAO3601712.1 S-adenosylmethionine-binding protein [Salmonella enterica]EAR6391609.1 S-adenosylmethionine-binding protein [Salmonella enterica]EAV1285254.1 S-adenosylmethionine-binding protein [Salmonella enterica]
MDAPQFNLIYADPPWQYKDKAKSGNRGVDFKYPTMKVEDICRLPVWALANPESCLLAMWWVPTMVEEALAVMKAWGFRLMTMKGFTWHKTCKLQQDKDAMGMGHMTRANSEDVLFAVRGRLPKRIDASIIQMVTAPRLEHSAKPAEVRHRLERLLGDVPRLEMFARGAVPGWATWGNQTECDVELVPARAVIPFDWKRPDSPWNPNNNLQHFSRPGISAAFAITEKKAMDDFCNAPIDGQPQHCARCGEFARLEYHTCVRPSVE